jgi:hypothetical protein
VLERPSWLEERCGGYYWAIAGVTSDEAIGFMELALCPDFNGGCYYEGAVSLGITGFLSARNVLWSLLSSLVFGRMFLRIVSATKFRYKLNESARGLPLVAAVESGMTMPSFVLSGYAMPVPNVFVSMLLSAVNSLHLLSTSN